ncbi:hypothetical protein PIB30_038325 [Stylosanthes scabra]|uniref:Uncharacterized protein n=1 Tax=Stylosanthes scabra TaxID=79078 RepID=A0ABU6VDZ0_9FABA|nr:hypothetical protein [Stylosanthes scabra]
MTILNSQFGETKKKILALKASSNEEESDDNNEGEEDQDFALLMKQFNKFAKKKNFNYKEIREQTDEEEENRACMTQGSKNKHQGSQITPRPRHSMGLA